MSTGKVAVIGGGALLAMLAISLGLFLYTYGGLPAWLLASAEKYQTVTTVELVDGGKTLRAVVRNGCEREPDEGSIAGDGTSTFTHGEEVYFTLGDGSILFLGNQKACRWDGGSARAGETISIDPDTPEFEATPSGRARFYHPHAWRFDNTTEPARVVQYDNAQLYRTGAGGLKIKEARIVFEGYVRKLTEIPGTLTQNFPWHRDVPWAEVDDPKYREYAPLGNFMGYSASLQQLADGRRCPGFDPDAEGPFRVPEANPCQRPHVEGQEQWLVESVKADFSELSFTIRNVSPTQIAIHHRETLLRKRGAPGREYDRSLLWEPRVCIDGLCFETEMLPFNVASHRVAYYPKRNQVVIVEAVALDAGNAFRWTDRRAP